jgi:acetoin:2,6-dichlorophenolindophenol oxidoreductase subunit alpha
VFVIENNVYGEYSRFDRTTPIEDLAERAASYGIPGAVVDGQDVDAVEEATREAAGRARTGGGPSLIEMKTYRYAGHSRSDQALYRPPGELDTWKARDPINIMAAKLIESESASSDELDGMRVQMEESIAATAERVLTMPTAGPEDMFRNIVATTGRVAVGGS